MCSFGYCLRVSRPERTPSFRLNAGRSSTINDNCGLRYHSDHKHPRTERKLLAAFYRPLACLCLFIFVKNLLPLRTLLSQLLLVARFSFALAQPAWKLIGTCNLSITDRRPHTQTITRNALATTNTERSPQTAHAPEKTSHTRTRFNSESRNCGESHCCCWSCPIISHYELFALIVFNCSKFGNHTHLLDFCVCFFLLICQKLILSSKSWKTIIFKSEELQGGVFTIIGCCNNPIVGVRRSCSSGCERSRRSFAATQH